MRQAGMSAEDLAFRTCLTHMRYARCTADDIRLLRTRVCRKLPQEFEDVPIITARNAYRDVINEVYAKRFVRKCDKPLHTFYSVDTWGSRKNTKSIHSAQRSYDTTADPARNSDVIGEKLQSVLWDLSPSLTGHHTGKLYLCEGMPVILKVNEATELGATNGAEAYVIGWDSHTAMNNKEVLDTLFVRLANPTRTSVHLDGLPENVIPLARTRQSVKCTLPVKDIKIYIQREQVTVLQCFAITDFAAQGCTRIQNVVYLKYCANHQSIYTCLSRSSSLAGTLIIDDFEASKLQRGASRALQAEFRDLELLDEISKLRTDNKLPDSVRGETRGEMISSFLATCPSDYVPPRADDGIDWNIFHSVKRQNPARSSQSNPNGKRPLPAEDWHAVRDGKRPMRHQNALLKKNGLRWDQQDYSCAYDAFFTLLWHIHNNLGFEWAREVAPSNVFTVALTSFFAAQPTVGHIDLQAIRDTLRDMLATAYPQKFPRRGPTFIFVADLITTLLSFATTIGGSILTCSACSSQVAVHMEMCDTAAWITPLHRGLPTNGKRPTVQGYLDILFSMGFPVECSVCRTYSPILTTLLIAPRLFALDVTSIVDIEIEHDVFVPVNGRRRTWTVCGVIYNTGNHYVLRYIDVHGQVWFHDGQRNEGCSVLQSTVIAYLEQTPQPGSRVSHVLYRLLPEGDAL
ncbi:hypothetical protein LXA43DRAFT_904069 [Ganoderma leucocontextum]|nr:hypothetical protein LXA43DRAFT_904069 [Ganoderma leucocontextum]